MVKSIRLVFDLNLLGFKNWCRKRLELMGIEVLEPPRGVLCHDNLLSLYAKTHDAIVVTRDKLFPYKHKIIIESCKYEKMWTELCRGIRGATDE